MTDKEKAKTNEWVDQLQSDIWRVQAQYGVTALFGENDNCQIHAGVFSIVARKLGMYQSIDYGFHDYHLLPSPTFPKYTDEEIGDALKEYLSEIMYLATMETD